jgi:AcrR family transcriptional regulator
MPGPKKQKPSNSAERKPLSHERILGAALALADKQGLEALSMRNLAAKLGVKAMSLYKYVANKDELLDGLVDILFGEIECPPETTPWREAMRLRAFSMRRVLLKHKWGSALIESRTASPSNAQLAHIEYVLTCLKAAGFDLQHQYRAFVLLDSYIYGYVLGEVNWPTTTTDQDRMTRSIESLLDKSPHPNLMTVMHEFMSTHPIIDGNATYDSEFEFGLNIILSGLEPQAHRRKS